MHEVDEFVVVSARLQGDSEERRWTARAPVAASC